MVLTPRAQKGIGMYMKAKELAETNGWFLARQFETAANADIHESTTAPEILADFKGERLDYFVTGYGTGGTVAGVGRVLKKTGRRRRSSSPSPPTPSSSARARRRSAPRTAGRRRATRPSSRTRSRAGRPDFIPLVLQEAIDGHYYDELIPIAGPEGMKWARELAAKEGILTGVSGGSTFGVAMQVAETAPEGSVILAMLPDTGERYLSTPLFEPFGADMNEEELEIMRSTPGYQMA